MDRPARKRPGTGNRADGRALLFVGMDPERNTLVRVRLSGVRRYAEQIGCRVETLRKDEASPAGLRAALRAVRPAGCIVDCSGWVLQDLPPKVFGRCPVVYSDCTPDAFGCDICCLTVDDAGVAQTAFRELSSGQPAALAVVRETAGHKWSETRAGVFAALARAAGYATVEFATSGTGGPGGGDEDLKAWASSLPGRTAIFAVNDPLAFRVAEAVKAAGRSIPRDIRILGVDNLVERYKQPCRLSSIALDFERFGWLAARMLFDLASGRVKPPANVSLVPRFVVRRDSTRSLSRNESFVAKALEIIRAEACSGLTVASLASRFKCSRALFDLRFREMSGHSAYDEILRIRLDRADALLANTDTPIGSIASFCGFGSEIALRRLFRRRTGFSMRDWRRAHAR